MKASGILIVRKLTKIKFEPYEIQNMDRDGFTKKILNNNNFIYENQFMDRTDNGM